MTPRSSSLFVVALLSAGVGAQGITLDAVGGSMPGTLDLELRGGIPANACAIIPGINPGPTPIAQFDPRDPRSMQVGPEMLGNALIGFFGPTGEFVIPTIQVPVLQGLLDAGFFFQGITFPGSATFVDRISNPRAIYLGNAGVFRDRFTFFVTERAFSQMLPRADGTWMISGGGTGALLAQIAERTTEIYDPLQDAFRFGASMTVERSIHTVTRLLDGRWLLVGGVNGVNDPIAACEIYDPATDTFSAVAPMGTPRAGHTATLLPDGRVLVTGGLQMITAQLATTISGVVASTEIYDPVTGVWTAGPNMRTPRVGHFAIVRPDNRVLLAGGMSFDTVIIIGPVPALRSNTDLFDPANGSMVGGPSMGAARALTEASDIGGGRYLVAGGISSIVLFPTATAVPTASAEIYDANTNAWSPTGSMASARGIHRTIDLGGGRLLHLGGADGDVLNPNPLSSTEVYSVSAGTFSPGPPLNVPRAGFSTFASPAGQVHVLGGGTSMGNVAKSTEWYYF